MTSRVMKLIEIGFCQFLLNSQRDMKDYCHLVNNVRTSVLCVCVSRYRMGKTENLITYVLLLVESYMTKFEE